MEDTAPDYAFAHARGYLAPWLATGVPPERAWELARRVEDHLVAGGRRHVSLDELRVVAREVLGEDEGDVTADRFRCWRDFEMLERPLVILIGGGTGVGKSTVATELAHTLGITRVSSTDFIRQVMRSVVPESVAPELSRSSFELDRHHSESAAMSHAEFERQAQQVLVGVRATIERAVCEGVPLILEGIHLLPGVVDLYAGSDSLLVQIVLTVDDEAEHSRRFAIRAEASARPAGRYDDGLDAIVELQDHLVAGARDAGIPVVENRQLDSTLRRVLDVIFAAIGDAVSPRRLEPAPG